MVLASWGLPLPRESFDHVTSHAAAAAAGEAARERYEAAGGDWYGNWLVSAPTNSGKTRIFIEITRWVARSRGPAPQPGAVQRLSLPPSYSSPPLTLPVPAPGAYARPLASAPHAHVHPRGLLAGRPGGAVVVVLVPNVILTTQHATYFRRAGLPNTMVEVASSDNQLTPQRWAVDHLGLFFEGRMHGTAHTYTMPCKALAVMVMMRMEVASSDNQLTPQRWARSQRGG